MSAKEQFNNIDRNSPKAIEDGKLLLEELYKLQGNCNEDYCIKLIEGGANLEVTDDHGWSAFMNGALYGHAKAMASMIKAGADIEQKDPEGYTALMYASYCGNKETVRVLLEAGANLNTKFKDLKNIYPEYEGLTAAGIAKERGHIEIAKMITEEEARRIRKIIHAGTTKKLKGVKL